MAGGCSSGSTIVPDLVLSASSLDAYDECHYRWYLSYVESEAGEQSVAAAIGSAVHTAIEHHYKAVMLGEPLDAKVIIDTYGLEYALNTAGIADPELPLDKALVWGRRALTTYLEDVAPTVEPVLVEHGELMDWDGVKVSGHLDVSDRRNVVHDTKIKKAKPRDPGRYLRAFVIYAEVHHVATGNEASDVQLDVIIRLKRDRPYHLPFNYGGPISQHDFDVTTASIHRVANGIARGDFRPTGLDEPGVCRYCPVKTVCAYYEETTRA